MGENVAAAAAAAAATAAAMWWWWWRWRRRLLLTSPQIRHHKTSWWSCAWHCHVVSSSAVSKLSMFVPSHDVQPSVPTLTVRWLPPARSARSLTCATQRR